MQSFLFIYEPISGDSRLVQFHDDYQGAFESLVKYEHSIPRHVEMCHITGDSFEGIFKHYPRYFDRRFQEFNTVEEALAIPFAEQPDYTPFIGVGTTD